MGVRAVHGFVLARPFGFEAGGHRAATPVEPASLSRWRASWATAAFRLVRVRGDSVFWAVTCSLIGFALLFAAGTAVGRVCLGFDSANASRYIPYMLPGLLALYLVIRRGARRSPVAYALLPVFLVACIAKEGDKISTNEAVAYSQVQATMARLLSGHARYRRMRRTGRGMPFIHRHRRHVFRRNSTGSRSAVQPLSGSDRGQRNR